MSSKDNGPLMMAATAVMKQGPSRIGSISKDIKLPRTILFKTFISVLLWGLFGMMIGAIIRSFNSVMYGGIIFGVLAYFATTFSPLKGESLTKYLGLTLKAQRERKYINGKLVRTYVGLTPTKIMTLTNSNRFILWVPILIKTTKGVFIVWKFQV